MRLPELLALLLLAGTAGAQLSVRPGHSSQHPHDVAWDLSGRSLKAPRVRAIHDPTGKLVGSSTWLIANDPFLAYAIGRDLNLRGWQVRDGVFGETGKLVGFTEPRKHGGGGGGTVPRDDAASCATCHNTPFGELGAGTTIPKDAGTGRNTPHVYGGGLVEMIGEEIGRQVLRACDTNGDGRIGREDRDAPIAVLPVPGSPRVDFGTCAAVDRQVRPTWVGADGRWVSWGTGMDSPGVAGWIPEVQVFGHGQAEGGIAATLRGFFVAAADVHMGLQARDPTLLDQRRGDGRSGLSPTGTRQFLSTLPRDRGRVVNSAGVSIDDPDRDGVLEELTQGDVDLAEFFLFHVPPPAERPSARARQGRALFRRMGCASCHVPAWRIPVDRRRFRLDVRVDSQGRATGHLARPDGREFVVHGVYSDFRRHDLGARFWEQGFDGSRQRTFRTTPLWGVGSTGPWGHDGASLSLDHVIRRHGGAAAPSTAAYIGATELDRDRVLAFLRSLVLTPINGLPADVDGDGAIASAWAVAGRSTGGPERFDPELLAGVPCRIEGPTRGYGGDEVFSRACLNVPALYRMDSAARKDVDGDGFPDIRDRCPAVHGVSDGCRSPANYPGP